MLEIFRDDIQNFDELMSTLTVMLQDSKRGLVDVWETIHDHILNDPNIDMNDDIEANHDKISEVHSIAYNAIDALIDDLDENDVNYRRIAKYLHTYHTYNGFNRLIVDFQDIVPEVERKRLIEQGKRIFVAELTEHWD